VKRRRLDNLWNYIIHGRSIEWTSLASKLLSRVVHHGGVFHLWGHSWELQETAQWERLEQVLFNIKQWTDVVPCLTNGEVIERMGTGAKQPANSTQAGDSTMKADRVVR
jgi:hypothetical protein